MAALIGLLGGTFDPVHNGHLAVARDLLETLGADSVRLILNAVPPHRTHPECPVGHRLAMLEAATTADHRLIPDTRELERIGPSYSVWTLRALRRDFPEASLFWIVGIDAWLGLERWYRWYELSSLAHFLVVKRPGWELCPNAAARLSQDADALRRRSSGARVLWDGPGIDVSASGIRRRIASGEDVSQLVPEPVQRYIQCNRLYGYR
ncbi:MAG: nicotinate-nucleotide adenylyltransferase [Gammaproteobacteria bacterium]|nr:nicotinate-nucleotide adenylyltransferase [Gammaproteobacteria bacterium]